MNSYLVPTDFSPVANQALTFAIHLASRTKARLEVLHVFDFQLLETDLLPFHVGQALAEGEDELALEQASSLVKTLMRKIGKEVPFEMNLRTGYPRESIVNACLDNSYDLIIMGTTGATNRLEQFFGSTTSSVMLESACPVLAIPPGTTFEGIRKIAYATDFREKGIRSYYELSRLAKSMDAEIHCIHVEKKSLSSSELAREEELLAPPMEFDQISFHVISNKNVADGLRSFIEGEQINLLAVEPRDHHFPDILWRKSVTRNMVLSSQIPLLSIKS